MNTLDFSLTFSVTNGIFSVIAVNNNNNLIAVMEHQGVSTNFEVLDEDTFDTSIVYKFMKISLKAYIAGIES